MKRKALSIALVLALIFILLPAFNLSTQAASSDSDMDALTALGIDTNEAPEGYDPYSTDNPYGRNTIEISPVYELFTVGLKNTLNYSASYTTSSTLQNGGIVVPHDNSYSNELQSSLYGNEKWDAKTVSEIMSAGETKSVASGITNTTGDYTLVSAGKVTDISASDISANGYLKDTANASTDLGSGFKYALSSVASGNFDTNTDGLSAQTVMVYTYDYSSNGGLFLRFGNAISGTYGTSAKELLPTSKKIGNPGLTYENKPVEDFAEAPYQLQNYLQVCTGDWNGDNIDEVAVYIPEEGNSRIIVYALQLTSADNKESAYLDASKWSVVWTYHLREGAVVSNMVSLVSGDVNEDGIDDLAATWGYYYGPTQNIGSKAVVMFGAKGTNMLTGSQQFDLTFGSSNIVRAAFAFGDMSGSGSDVLILCGQSDADLKVGNTQTRYVALYSWNGTAFTSSVYQNFDIFAKEDGKYVWSSMAYHGDKFYSLPLCTANAALISQGISGGGDLLYFDSLIIEYTDKGLSIKEAWDLTESMQQNTLSPVLYVEYNALAGDLTGQTGSGALVTITQTLSTRAQNTASYTVIGSHQEPAYSWTYYYQNWLYKLFNIKTWYTYISSYITVSDDSTVSVGYDQLTMGKAYMVTVDPFAAKYYYYSRTETDFSTSACLTNTDNDSSYMKYSGTHYYTYTDPEVLAVLASPPYFSDLINRDDLSGSYAESTTSYSSTTGSGSGYDVSATISLGRYISFEQDIEVFGVKVASIEAEATFTSSFTFETEKTSNLEQTVTYSATSGEDMVAFYSIPMEIYEYTSYVANGFGGYKKILTTVNIPHEAAIRLLSIDEYESIAKDYSVLPAIADNVLTHTLGDPSTYPSGTDGYDIIAQYNGTPAAVGFSSVSGGSGIGQEIAMSTEKSNAFSTAFSVEAKAGAGAGGLKVGFIAGAELGAGLVFVSTDGNSFSGEMQNMPVEAQPYGYGMNWRIICYEYNDGGSSFPVVSYVVSDIQNPAPLPDDFEQNISATTSDSITLAWSYDKTVAGFKLYRYYEFPDGSGSYEIAYVPFTSASRYDSSTGIYYFNFVDDNNNEGLSPYTEYLYQIQTIRASNPKESIWSEPISCRTKTQVGYPVISISGLNENGQLPIYPDANSTVSLSVAGASNYNGLSYQWQKLINGIWTDISGRTGATFTISNAGAADNTTYRCRVNAIYYDLNSASNYYISAYSATIVTAYAKRTPIASNFTASETVTTGVGGIILKGLTAGIELYSANADHSAAPTGNVTFNVKGTDYEYSETIALATSSGTKFLGDAEKYYSTASLSIASLPEGVYNVTAYYSGSRVFKDMGTRTSVLVVVGDGSAYDLSLSVTSGGNSVTKFDYGKNIWPTLISISKDVKEEIQQETITGVMYKITPSGSSTITDFTAGSLTPNVGSYTLQAYVSGILVASQEFTVGKKPITIKVNNKTNISAIDVEANPPVIACSDLNSTDLAALNLSYVALNSAGNLTVLNNSTDPGNYSVIACTSSATNVTLYNNYSVTYVSGVYTIIGATYRLTALAAPYTDQAGTRPVGAVGISNAQQSYADYTSGTAVLMYATPKAGYQIDKWTALFGNGTKKTQSGGTTFTITTEAQPVSVSVTFKPAEIRLSTVSQPAAGGEITCSDDYFTSGAFVSYGAEYFFTATPSDGYHFSKWQTVSGGTTITLDGTAGTSGSNNLMVTAGTAPMTVYAIFMRDTYTLTLTGDIFAYYMFDHDGDSTTDTIEKPITSGSAVAGDTEVTVKPKAGYQAADGKYFTKNGIVSVDTESHIFNITKNTTVSLSTIRNNYAVTVIANKGTVMATVGGVAADSGDLASIEGGSALSFTAHADRGYVFDHWTLNGEVVVNSMQTLNISELGRNTNIVAVFAANTAYAANAAVSVTSRGIMNYTLYDIYGDLVGKANTAMPSEGLTVYMGESITLSVSVVSGSMMEQWEVNNVNTYTTQKTYTINNISYPINAVAYLKAASSYLVNFIAIGETGSTLSATVDGVGISSGTLQYGGSELLFSVTPADGYMLDHWTVTSGGLTASENNNAVDSAGNTICIPVYSIDPLKQNVTVRAYFTELSTNLVTLPDTTTMGVSTITYVTPIRITDDGRRNITTDSVRSRGMIRLTFTPNNGFDTSMELLKTLLKAKLNTDATVSVEKVSGVYNVTVNNLKQTVSLTESDIYRLVYNITVPAGVTVSPNPSAENETVTLIVTPGYGFMLSELKLDTGTLNELVSPSRLIYTFEMPASDVTVSAKFTYSNSGGDGGAIPITVPITIPVSGNTTSKYIPITINDKSIDIPITINGGLASLLMDKATQSDLISYTGRITLDLTTLQNVTGAVIPSDAFSAFSRASEVLSLSISLPDAKVTFDKEALTAITAAGGGDVTITADMVDTATLTPQQLALIGDRPVIDLTFKIGSVTVSEFGNGSVDVSVPYKLIFNEDPKHVVVWYLNNKGILEPVTGQYDTATSSVIFVTNHFSKYILGNMPFNDVLRDKWYFNSISYAYANGLFSGTGDSTFEPEISMTRAMLVTVLWRMEGEPVAVDSLYTDVIKGQWYSSAVGWATEHGIVSGYGGGLFGTEDAITREQMAVILMNYANYKKFDVSATVNLNTFSDSGKINNWAMMAMKWANAEGLINGTGNASLEPLGYASRSQVAAILQRFFDNVVE